MVTVAYSIKSVIQSKTDRTESSNFRRHVLSKYGEKALRICCTCVRCWGRRRTEKKTRDIKKETGDIKREREGWG